MSRHNYAVIVKPVKSKNGEGWLVDQIIDTTETTCCGYAYAWLRQKHWFTYGAGSFLGKGNGTFQSEKSNHQIYSFKEHSWSAAQYVFFTKYPENYVDGRVGYYPGSQAYSNSLKSLPGRLIITFQYTESRLAKIQQEIELRNETEARIDELSKIIAGHQLRVQELKEQLKKIPVHNWVG